MPLRGPLESPFGERWGRLHAGQDIAVLHTDRVHAAASGVVRAVGYLAEHSGYGNVVEIRHDDGLVTMYAHLSSTLVRVGAAGGARPADRTRRLHGLVHRPAPPLRGTRGGRPVDPARVSSEDALR